MKAPGYPYFNKLRLAARDFRPLSYEPDRLNARAGEPSVPERLLGLPNVVLTPHIASATLETRAAMTRVLVENVLAFLSGEPLPNPVDR